MKRWWCHWWRDGGALGAATGCHTMFGVWSLLCALQTQLCLLALMDTTVALEDPFDEVALNAVSMAEAMDATAMVGEVGLGTGCLKTTQGRGAQSQCSRGIARFQGARM